MARSRLSNKPSCSIEHSAPLPGGEEAVRGCRRRWAAPAGARGVCSPFGLLSAATMLLVFSQPLPTALPATLGYTVLLLLVSGFEAKCCSGKRPAASWGMVVRHYCFTLLVAVALVGEQLVLLLSKYRPPETIAVLVNVTGPFLLVVLGIDDHERWVGRVCSCARHRIRQVGISESLPCMLPLAIASLALTLGPILARQEALEALVWLAGISGVIGALCCVVHGFGGAQQPQGPPG